MPVGSLVLITQANKKLLLQLESISHCPKERRRMNTIYRALHFIYKKIALRKTQDKIITSLYTALHTSFSWNSEMIRELG